MESDRVQMKIRVAPELHDRLRAAANYRYVSMASIVERAIEEHLDKEK